MTNAELVEKIKRILEDPESVPGDEQKETARVYAARLRRVDEGFRRALGQLNSGMLSEADRIMTDSSLLEEYASLILPGAEDWQVVCRTFDFEVAPTLPLGGRDKLAEFAAQYAPASELFRRRRRQVMENAPLRSQLETLYQIKDLMGARDFVVRQIERLEKLRSEELSRAAKGITAENVFSLDFGALLAEFNDARRLTPVPAETIEKYRSWYEYTRSCNELTQLRQLIAQWQAAYDAQDAGALLACLAAYRAGEFRHAAGYVTAEETQRLSALVDYTLKVEHADALRTDATRKLEALRAGLLRVTDSDKLYDLWNAAEVAVNNAGMSMPPELERDYSNAVDSIETQGRRKRTAVVAFIAVACLFFAGLTTLAVMHSKFVKDAGAAAAALAEQLDAAEKFDAGTSAALDVAAKMVERNEAEHPKFAGYPDYAAEVDRFNALMAAEKARVAEIEKLVDQIDAAHEAGTPAARLLESLKGKLRGDAEKEKYGYVDLYRDDMALLNAKNAAAADSYSEILDALVVKQQSLDNDAVSVAETKQTLAELHTGLNKLADMEKSAEAKGETIAAPLLNSRIALEAAVAGTERRFKFRVALEKNGAALLPAVGKPKEYLAVLKRIKDEVGDISAQKGDDLADSTETILSDALDAAMLDVPNADAAAAWNKFAGLWKTVNATVRSATASQSAEKALAPKGLAFAPEYSTFAETRKPFQAFAANGGYEGTAKKLFDATRLYKAQTWTLYDAEEERYFYLTSNPREKTSGLKYVADPETDSTRDFPADSFDSTVLAAATSSVQSAIAAAASGLSGVSVSPDAWFGAVRDIVAKLDAADEKALDPVLKLQLCAVLIDAVRGYPGFEELGKWLDGVRDSSNFDFKVNPYQPGKELLEQRDIARKDLRSLPDLTTAIAAAKDAFDDGEKTLGAEYRWVGYLDEVNANGVLVLASGQRVPDGSTLWIARGENASAQEIGVMENGSAKFTADLGWAAYRWTPIYARIAN